MRVACRTSSAPDDRARAKIFHDEIATILAREPNHPDAKILLGKVQLKRQKLMEATEVELGSNTAQDSLVPGEKLKVTLTDPTALNLPQHHVFFTHTPTGFPCAVTRQRLDAAGGDYRLIDAPHDGIVTHPAEVAALIIELARR